MKSVTNWRKPASNRISTFNLKMLGYLEDKLKQIESMKKETQCPVDGIPAGEKAKMQNKFRPKIMMLKRVSGRKVLN